MRYEYLSETPAFTAKNINILNVSRPKGYRHSFSAGREKYGFIYTVSGRVRDSFGPQKEDIVVGPGELIFIPKDCVYTGLYLDDDTEIKIVQFDLADGSLPDYLSQPVKIVLPRVAELINAFFEPTENRQSNHTFYYLSCLYRLLWMVEESNFSIPARFSRLRPALREINEQFYKNDPVSRYARMCGMSEVNFRRLFKEYTGLSPIDYRNSVRLNYAKDKLRSGVYNVSETATICGFSNLSFFTRLYKAKFGHTPKKEL